MAWRLASINADVRVAMLASTSPWPQSAMRTHSIIVHVATVDIANRMQSETEASTDD